jgi:ABC-type polysaccharide/polyol phosphate transport system ATPase subunit
MNAESPVIRVENISVRYRVPEEKLSGIKEFTIRWLQRRLGYRHFWALRELDFAIKSGEIFGIIGRNGAGKSTLLKVMARILVPTQGRIIVVGKTAPLLEVGAGFHPELTGRENVYLNAALLGYSRAQMQTRFDQIVTFAGVQDFIDAPLRTYSTGMVARLGFAVATSVRPDILLVDEVLSVGDVAFQEKCLDRMRTFQQQGTTIVLVTHALDWVRQLCQRAIWLEEGSIAAQGQADTVVQRYLQVK